MKVIFLRRCKIRPLSTEPCRTLVKHFGVLTASEQSPCMDGGLEGEFRNGERREEGYLSQLLQNVWTERRRATGFVGLQPLPHLPSRLRISYGGMVFT